LAHCLIDPWERRHESTAARALARLQHVALAGEPRYGRSETSLGETSLNPNDATSFRDPIAHACYPAQIKFLQSLPQIQAIKAPAPYNVIVMFRRKRDLVAQIKAGLPGYLKVGCSTLLQDEVTILTQTLGLIGVSVGAGVLSGVFPPAAPIALPLLGG
jgi:hypothetical protein